MQNTNGSELLRPVSYQVPIQSTVAEPVAISESDQNVSRNHRNLMKILIALRYIYRSMTNIHDCGVLRPDSFTCRLPIQLSIQIVFKKSFLNYKTSVKYQFTCEYSIVGLK